MIFFMPLLKVRSINNKIYIWYLNFFLFSSTLSDSVPDEITNVVDEDFIEIEHGQNMLQVHVEGLFLSDAGLSLLKKMGLESGSDYENDLSGFLANFTTFVHFDFYEFESQVTPLGVGVKPHFNHTSRFKVIVDDFFLQYLQSHAMIFNVCRSNGLDFYNFGFW